MGNNKKKIDEILSENADDYFINNHDMEQRAIELLKNRYLSSGICYVEDNEETMAKLK